MVAMLVFGLRIRQSSAALLSLQAVVLLPAALDLGVWGVVYSLLRVCSGLLSEAWGS